MLGAQIAIQPCWLFLEQALDVFSLLLSPRGVSWSSPKYGPSSACLSISAISSPLPGIRFGLFFRGVACSLVAPCRFNFCHAANQSSFFTNYIRIPRKHVRLNCPPEKQCFFFAVQLHGSAQRLQAFFFFLSRASTLPHIFRLAGPPGLDLLPSKTLPNRSRPS